MGGPEKAALLRLAAASANGLEPIFRRITTLVEVMELRFDRSWQEDADTFLNVKEGIKELIERSSPVDPKDAAELQLIAASPPEDQERLFREYHERFAELVKPGIQAARMIQPIPWRHPGLKASNVGLNLPTIEGVQVTSTGPSPWWPKED